MRMSDATAFELSSACDDYFGQLLIDGCDKEVAFDRTYDAFASALDDDPERHCFDKRDRLFENRLRTIIKRRETE